MVWHKVIDLGRLLWPRKDGNPIALKYLSYGLLQTNIQSGVHSSLSDCFATLKLFHLAPTFIMASRNQKRKYFKRDNFSQIFVWAVQRNKLRIKNFK